MSDKGHPGVFALRTFLRDCGLGAGGNVLIHSAFSTMRPLGLTPAGFIEVVREAIGPEGTMAMPTFNWDILHQGPEIVFDIRNTPSNMGRLTEVFRLQPGTVRCRNLFNPLAFHGPLAAEAAALPNETSWGDDSPFTVLYDHDFTILLVGTDYNTLAMIHRAEQLAQAPYRFHHVFENAFLVDEAGGRSPVQCSTLRRKESQEIDFNRIAGLLESHGVVRIMPLGDALVRVMRARALVDFLVPRLREEPRLLVRDEPALRRVPTRTDAAFSPMELIKDLWLRNRALVSGGFEESLAVIGRSLPLRVHRFPSGSKVFDWEVPQRWNCSGGVIKTLDGRVVADLGDHPLRIAAGSRPFCGVTPREELLARIFSDEQRPDAIPYVTKYHQDDWAVCLRWNERQALTEDAYEVVLETELTAGELLVGEHVVQGEITDSIAVPVHLDHPGQCNDNLSGVAVAVEAARMLGKARPRHTLRFLFLPETIGSYAYLSMGAPGRETIRWAIAPDCVGAGGEPFLMRTVEGGTRLDTCARLAMAQTFGEFREYAFLENFGFGNDERAFQAPNLRIPAVAVSRYPYPEYHSSLDTPSIIRPAYLRQAREFLLALIAVLDRDFVPRVACVGIPQLGKRGLWEDSAANPLGAVAIEKVLFHADGKRSVAELAELAGVGFEWAWKFFRALEGHGLVERACDGRR